MRFQPFVAFLSAIFRPARSPFLAAVCAFTAARADAALEASVPFGGNAYLTTEGAGDGMQRDGSARWQGAKSVFSIYFRADRAAVLDLALRLKVPQGVSRTGPVFAVASELMVSSTTDGLKLDCVKNNEGNMFCWGRRGPSVHLGYAMPRDKTIEYAYGELTVPVGEDPIGSYFMANGFGEGYYGIQAKNPTERWILFSVSSPLHTNNPRDIPADQRVVLLGKGEGVRVG